MKFTFDIPKASQPAVRLWLVNSLLSLSIAGLLAIILLFARTPFLQNYFPYKDFFYSALVVHVDLSVLFWLLSVTNLLYTTIILSKFLPIAKLNASLSIIGTLLIAISPFMSESVPIMNNYIPVIINLTFFIGLAFFACAVFLQILITLASFHYYDNLFKLSLYVSALINLIGIICFICTERQLQQQVNLYSTSIQNYYEILFWSGGHILQFSYVQIMQLIWLVIIFHNEQKIPNIFFSVILLNIIFAIPAIPIHLLGVTSGSFHLFFTEQMRYFGSVAPTITFIILLYYLKKTPYMVNFISSAILFFSGGLIGLLIKGSNVVIPAHYHGSIIAVTIAGMTLIYIVMDKLNIKRNLSKLTNIQSIILCAGQLFHILGLAWSGGYGELRKTPSAMHTIEAKLSMGLMGFGGFLAVIGGALFIIIAWPVFNLRSRYGS